jgi:hypothetical protein
MSSRFTSKKTQPIELRHQELQPVVKEVKKTIPKYNVQYQEQVVKVDPKYVEYHQEEEDGSVLPLGSSPLGDGHGHHGSSGQTWDQTKGRLPTGPAGATERFRR